jgi:hypothetical protein
MSPNRHASHLFRRPVRSVAAAGAAALLAAATGAALLAPEEARAGGYACAAREHLTVHEWGTFTSMQGSDGVTLEGLHHEEEGLPAFVYSRSEVRDCPLRRVGWKGLEVPVAHVTEKMETPVTYFYLDAPFEQPFPLTVRVGFEKGLLTQWYPVVDTLGPAEGPAGAGALDMRKVERSFLEWDIELLKRGTGLDAIPAVAKDDPWACARLPESNVVRTTPREAPRQGPVESEKFLFYRGLGTFTLPVRAETLGDGAVRIRNDGDEPLRHVFLVNVGPSNAAIDYAPLVPAKSEVSIEAPLERKRTTYSVDGMIAVLRPRLEKALVDCGLFPKEAEAMTRTWEKSYFRTEGLRVLYVVPEKTVNEVLPLTITPAPKKVVRVLVGRLECIEPEVEKEVAGALVDRTSRDDARRVAADARLARLGRFLEPHVRRVLTMQGTEVAHASAREVLAKIEAEGR